MNKWINDEYLYKDTIDNICIPSYHFKGPLLSISAGKILLFLFLCWKESSSSSSSSSEMAMLNESTIRNISDLSIAFPSKLNSKLSLAFVPAVVLVLCLVLIFGGFFIDLMLLWSWCCGLVGGSNSSLHNSSSDFDTRVFLLVDSWIGCKKW